MVCIYSLYYISVGPYSSQLLLTSKNFLFVAEEKAPEQILQDKQVEAYVISLNFVFFTKIWYYHPSYTIIFLFPFLYFPSNFSCLYLEVVDMGDGPNMYIGDHSSTFGIPLHKIISWVPRRHLFTKSRNASVWGNLQNNFI